MKFDFSKNVMGMSPSEIRELNKMASTPGLISLGGGMPSPETFPVEELTEIINYIMKNKYALALQYGNTLGIESTREAISEMLKKSEGIETGKENIVVNSGSQQGLFEVGNIFANPGSSIITEEPTYTGAVSAFSAGMIHMEGIDMEKDGLNVDMVEEKIKKMKKVGNVPKFIYTIPNFQNPSGITMSLKKREKLLDISINEGIPIVEDNPYGQLRYRGQNIKSIRALNGAEDVIYLGTFSKVMTPGLRIGYTVAPKEVMEKINLIKQALDLATNSLSQYIAEEYIGRGIIYEQVKKNISIYSKKRDRMVNALNTYMSEDGTFVEPDGGMFVWFTLNENINTKEMIPDAIRNGVAYVSGNAFTTNGSQKNSMRLNFTFGSEKDLEEGIKRLKKTIDEKKLKAR
ncbi:aminotransferase-like domain-containing protein [Caldiplasma sukawensis]